MINFATFGALDNKLDLIFNFRDGDRVDARRKKEYAQSFSVLLEAPILCSDEVLTKNYHSKYYGEESSANFWLNLHTKLKSIIESQTFFTKPLVAKKVKNNIRITLPYYEGESFSCSFDFKVWFEKPSEMLNSTELFTYLNQEEFFKSVISVFDEAYSEAKEALHLIMVKRESNWCLGQATASIHKAAKIQIDFDNRLKTLEEELLKTELELAEEFKNKAAEIKFDDGESALPDTNLVVYAFIDDFLKSYRDDGLIFSTPQKELSIEQIRNVLSTNKQDDKN